MISRRNFGILGGMSMVSPRPDQSPPASTGLPPAAVPGNVFPFIIIVGPASKLLVYSPTVGANNLIAGISAVAGHDSFGNNYQQGVGSYDEVHDTAVVLNKAGISWYKANSTNTVAALMVYEPASGVWEWFADVQTLLNLVNGNNFEILGGPIQLDNLAGTPASVASASLLYSDAFSQVHTDRAVVTEVDVETKNQGSPPGAGGSGPKWYGSSGYGLFQSGQTGIGGDTNSYDTGRLTLIAAGQTVSSTSGVTVTGLTKTLGVGTYHVRGAITYEGSQNAGTPTIGFTEPLLTSAWYTSQYLVATNNASATSPLTAFNNTGFDGLSTSHTGPTLVLNQFVTFSFDAIVTTSASGALTMQAKTSNGADTFVIQAGGYMEIMPVVAT